MIDASKCENAWLKCPIVFYSLSPLQCYSIAAEPVCDPFFPIHLHILLQPKPISHNWRILPADEPMFFHFSLKLVRPVEEGEFAQLIKLAIICIANRLPRI